MIAEPDTVLYRRRRALHHGAAQGHRGSLSPLLMMSACRSSAPERARGRCAAGETAVSEHSWVAPTPHSNASTRIPRPQRPTTMGSDARQWRRSRSTLVLSCLDTERRAGRVASDEETHQANPTISVCVLPVFRRPRPFANSEALASPASRPALDDCFERRTSRTRASPPTQTLRSLPPTRRVRSPDAATPRDLTSPSRLPTRWEQTRTHESRPSRHASPPGTR